MTGLRLGAALLLMLAAAHLVPRLLPISFEGEERAVTERKVVETRIAAERQETIARRKRVVRRD